MDVKRKQNHSSKLTKNQQIVAVLIAVLALIAWLVIQPSAVNKVSKDKIWIASVQQGDLKVQVQAYGKLKSKVQRLITAPTNATVEEIILKPGAIVTANTILLQLSNPDLVQQVRDAHSKLESRTTNHRQLLINQKREILSNKIRLESLFSRLEVAQLKVVAETPLVDKGIVSKIDFKASKLDERQLVRQLALEQERLVQLKELHQENLTISQNKIAQQHGQIEVLTQRSDRLTVKAGMAGVLQEMPLSLGESVTLGQQLALVGSMNDLVANLTVPQSQMSQLQIKQKVSVDTHGGLIQGFVSRIDPVVADGGIQIEVELTSQLTKNSRPELTIDGTIYTANLNNVLYLKKPVNAMAGGKTKLFRLKDQGETAEAIAVVYGEETDEFIQIIAGVSNGDSFILSDMSRWQDVAQITITD